MKEGPLSGADQADGQQWEGYKLPGTLGTHGMVRATRPHDSTYKRTSVETDVCQAFQGARDVGHGMIPPSVGASRFMLRAPCCMVSAREVDRRECRRSSIPCARHASGARRQADPPKGSPPTHDAPTPPGHRRGRKPPCHRVPFQRGGRIDVSVSCVQRAVPLALAKMATAVLRSGSAAQGGGE